MMVTMSVDQMKRVGFHPATIDLFAGNTWVGRTEYVREYREKRS